MKKNYTLSFLLVLVGLLRLGAQNITATQTVFNLQVKATDTDANVETHIKNNSANAITLSWDRTVTCTSDPIWGSYVCDPNLCYGEATSSAVLPIVIEAGAEGLFSFHINAHGAAGNGEFKLKIFETGNPDNNVELVIKANGAACASSSTDEPTIADIEVAPNPTVDHFRLIDAETIIAVNIMSLDGRRIAHFEATPDHVYHIGNLPTANYILGLEDRTGRTVRAIQLKKQ